MLALAAYAGSGASSRTAGSSPGAAVCSHANAARPPAAALAQALKQAGLPITHLIVYNAGTDPNHEIGRQGGYTSKVAWVDPAAVKAGAGQPSGDLGGIESGGGIEVFAAQAAAHERIAYLRGFQPPLGEGYDFLAGTAILRLSNYLTPAQADAYRAAFIKAAS
jgi:hypothetical protein